MHQISRQRPDLNSAIASSAKASSAALTLKIRISDRLNLHSMKLYQEVPTLIPSCDAALVYRLLSNL